jgi:hypothetical protein
MPANLFAAIRPYESDESYLRIHSPLFAPMKIVFCDYLLLCIIVLYCVERLTYFAYGIG